MAPNQIFYHIIFYLITTQVNPTHCLYDYYFNTNDAHYSRKYFGCTDAGCTVSKTWQLDGYCIYPHLNIKFWGSDFRSTSERAHVKINDIDFGECEGLDADETNQFEQCENVYKYNLTQNNLFDIDSINNTLNVTLSISNTVDNDDGAYDLNGTLYYLYSEVTIACYDYILEALPGSVSNTQEFGCEYENCNVTRVWNVVGACKDPKLYVTIVETDYSSSSETASIIVENDRLGTCDELIDDCTHDFVDCSNVYGYDLGSYIDSSQASSDEYISVTLTSDGANICKYIDTYTLYGRVTIECVSYELDLIVQFNADSDRNYNVTDEISWTVSYTAENGIEYGTILRGNGTLIDSESKVNQTVEATDGCYDVAFDITTNSDSEVEYGWFEVYLDSKLISHGKQKMTSKNGNGVHFYFCTSFFAFLKNDESDWNSTYFNNSEVATTGAVITIESMDYEAIITFTDFEETDVYYENYIAEADSTTSTSELYITDGCYKVVFDVQNDIFGYDYSYSLAMNVNDETLYIMGPNTTDGYNEEYFCTNGTYTERVHADCSNNIGTQSFTFEIDVDYYPEEVAWQLYEYGDVNKTGLSGDAMSVRDFSHFYSSGCINSGTCYTLMVNDTWGDGMVNNVDDFGWFRLYLDENLITFDKQSFNDDFVQIKFCTDLFGGAKNNLTIILYLEGNLDDFNSDEDGIDFQIYDSNEIDFYYLVYDNKYYVPYFEIRQQRYETYNNISAVIDTLWIDNGYFTMVSTTRFDIIVQSSVLFESYSVKNVTTPIWRMDGVSVESNTTVEPTTSIITVCGDEICFVLVTLDQ